MLVECLIQRDGPTVATFGGFTYEFQEAESGAKICDVNNGGHLDRMLSMPAFYRVYEPGEKTTSPPEPGAKPPLEIPDFDLMSLDEVREWAFGNLRLKLKANMSPARAIAVIEHELRKRGLIA